MPPVPSIRQEREMCKWRNAISPATAMRALVAIFALVLCAGQAHAHRDTFPRALLTALGVKHYSPVHRLLTCTQSLGPTKCITAFSAWRAEKAMDMFETEMQPEFNLTSDVQKFPWERFNNNSDEQIYSQLCDGTEKLLRHRSLSLTVLPGYKFELESKGNGMLSVDVVKNTDTVSARGTVKKVQKQFYDLIPILLIPGLIMSAILPFILPAIKLMTVAVGMMNNMALSAAVFTLMRNNAFNDHYEKKVIYVNEGYKNEKHSPVYYQDIAIPLESLNAGASNNVYNVVDSPMPIDFDQSQIPTDEDWINQYYGNQQIPQPHKNRRQ